MSVENSNGRLGGGRNERAAGGSARLGTFQSNSRSQRQPNHYTPQHQHQQQQQQQQSVQQSRVGGRKLPATASGPPPDRYYLAAMESSKRLDQAMQNVSCCEDLFKSNLIRLRHRLRQQCDAVVFQSHHRLARVAEQLLWKKTCYDVISYCKSTRSMSPPLLGAYLTHMTAAAGYYQHFLLKLQFKFRLEQVSGLVDWLPSMEVLAEILPATEGEDDSALAHDEATVQWVVQAVRRTLIALGDIARYQVDYMSGAQALATRYYHQAICLDPSHGMPQNQLAAIALMKDDYITAAFHYVMGLSCCIPFQGTEANLLRLYEKMPAVLEAVEQEISAGVVESLACSYVERRFICHFLALHRAVQTGTRLSSVEMNQLVRAVVDDFEEWFRLLAADLAVDGEGGDDGISSKTLDAQKSEGLRRVGGIALRVIAMAILLAQRLRIEGSSDTRTIVNFVLSLISHLVEFCSEVLKTSPLLAVMANTPLDKKTHTAGLNDIFSPGLSSLAAGDAPTSDATAPAGGESASFQLPVSFSIGAKMSLDDAVSAAVETKYGLPIDASALRNTSQRQQARRRQRRRQPHRRRSRKSACESSGSSTSSSDGDDDDDEKTSDESNEDVSDGDDEDRSPSYDDADGDDVADWELDESVIDFNTSDTIDFHRHVGRSQSASAVCNPALRPIGDEKRSSALDTGATTSVTGSEVEGSDDIMWSPVSLLTVAESLPVLMAVHVAFDWLQSNPYFLSSFAKSDDRLWTGVADLLNSLPRQEQLDSGALDLGISDTSSLYVSRHPLPEDVALLGFSPLAGKHERYDFDWSNCNGLLSSVKETVLRVHRLQSFGQAMAESKLVTNFQWSSEEKRLLGPEHFAASQREEEERQVAEKEAEASKKREKLMKAMAKQKLKSEVQQLQGSAKKPSSASKPLSPYVVVDTEALLLHFDLVEALASSHRFMVIVPTQVIDYLDELKLLSTHQAARDAIKKLESYFHRSSRWLRAQRSSEIHAPPSKDRPSDPAELQAWRFSRVVDCCVYFIQHANIKSKTLIFRSLSHSLVTLLTGQAILQPRDAALASLDTPLERAVSEARSAGADVYPVRQFYKAFVQTSSATAAGSQREYRSSSHSRRGTSDHRFSGQRGMGMAQRHSEGAPQRRRPRSNSLHKPSPATPSDPASISADLTRRGSRGQPREGRGGGVHSGGRGRRGNKG